MSATPASSPSAQGIFRITRRGFLGNAAGGLVLGVFLPSARAAGEVKPAEVSRAAFVPNAFVRIGSDGIVTVIAKHLEMGQGTDTGLATLVAEELDADWSKVRVEGAPADASRYANLFLKTYQGTAGSSSIANSFEQMRRAGATARAMLVAAAAQQWAVPPAEVSVESGVLHHAASGRHGTFGEFACSAARLGVPAEVKLKLPGDFKLIGKTDLRRMDSVAKTSGTAVYTQDVKLPGMLVAVAAHPRKFGATIKAFDAGRARRVSGVVAVVPFEGTPHSFAGVAVLATNTWAAITGRDALSVQWDEARAYTEGSAALIERYRDAARRPAAVAHHQGDFEASLSAAAKVIEAEYCVPFLAHAAMEPMNCSVRLSDDACEIWNGDQWQTVDQQSIGALLGITPEQVQIHQLYAGGSFGRRASPQSDYLVEAVCIAKAARAAGTRSPIKLVWTREDDMRGGYYRPANLHLAKLALDANGKLVGWHHRLVGQSVRKDTMLEQYNKGGIDNTSVDGVSNLPYDIPNVHVELHTPEGVGVPVQWYRSVGQSQNAFPVEGLIDEAAAAAGADPVAYRRQLLLQRPRHLAVLDLAAEKAGWTQPLKAIAGVRRGRGVAIVEAFRTCVAQIAEVTVTADGSVNVDRVVCAIDCGVAINPDVVKAQMEGAVGFGLNALNCAVTLSDGAIVQSNFHDYPVLRIDAMPRVDVHIVPSAGPPTGVGEPGVPAVVPAVVNAIFNATGKRVRSLPLEGQLKVSA
jgi:isoquinoline 1-oxidoreductase beta subunit